MWGTSQMFHGNHGHTYGMDASHLYSFHELHRASLEPVRIMAEVGKQVWMSPYSPLAYTPAGRTAGAACTLVSRMTRHYGEPEWGIHHTEIDGRKVKVTEKVVLAKPFCELLHFEKSGKHKQPRLLVVAPLSGHYATLLRGTVQALLPHADVYITDWINAREIPLSQGSFDLDDYIDYVMEFLRHLGPGTHTMAVCQPSVPLFGAAALMSAAKDKCAPATMTLIGGPIDTRVNPTKVNELAYKKDIKWFEKHVISRVPFNYPGFMRKVYPGFVQLTGFMSMNMDRHVGEHIKLFNHLVEGDGDSAAAHREFYNEYLSVMDLPAEFYLQTVKTVFQDFALPKGTWVSRGRKIDAGAITKTALLCIEGEKDDISGVGQTKAAIKLCKNLPEKKKTYYLQKGAGHYGVFNGKKYREHIVPVIVEHMHKHGK